MLLKKKALRTSISVSVLFWSSLFSFFLACSLVGVLILRFVVVTVYCIAEHWRGSPTAVLLLFLFSICFKLKIGCEKLKFKILAYNSLVIATYFSHLQGYTPFFYRNSGPGWSILDFCSFVAEIFLWVFLAYREECALFFTGYILLYFSDFQHAKICSEENSHSRVHSWHILKINEISASIFF